MILLGTLSIIVGVLGVLIGALILLPKIFIPKEELELLEQLPVEPSTTNMTSSITNKTLPVTVTNTEILMRYKKLYIKNRMEDSKKGRKGFWFLVIGSLLQIAGAILIYFA